MGLANKDTGIKGKTKIDRYNLMCKKIISKDFENFRIELNKLCKEYDFKISSSREWSGDKQITFIPVLKSRRVRYGKLK